jgi:cytochrome c-type protein NapC
LQLPTSPLALISLACAALAALSIAFYLLKRPPLGDATRLLLLLALGVFPIGTAVTGNLEGLHATKQRNFCGSCHVMIPYAEDSGDPASQALAARHGRNHLFGEENCYTCHADYGMFGTVLTKFGGMKHVYYYVTEYRTMPLAEAKEKIHIKAPYQNNNCMQCHSTTLDLWGKIPDHRSSLQDVRSGRISCASAGCHGFAHPFSKPASSFPAPGAAPPGAAPPGAHP